MTPTEIYEHRDRMDARTAFRSTNSRYELVRHARTHGPLGRIIGFVWVVSLSSCGAATRPQAPPADRTQAAPTQPSPTAAPVEADAGIEPISPEEAPDAGQDATGAARPCAYELQQTTPTVLVARSAGLDRGPGARAPGAAQVAEELERTGVHVLGARDCITCGPICMALGCNNRMIVLRLSREQAREQICAGLVNEAPPSEIRLNRSMACPAPGPTLVCPALP